MKRFLITGGAGFIGSNLAERLLERGDSVRILDNFSTGRMESIEGFRKDLEVIEGDVRDRETVRQAMKGVEFCLHQAALTSVARSVENPVDTAEVNVGGTLGVLLAAKELGAVKVVYASSSSVYGSNPELPRREDSVPEPLSPYAMSKFIGEYYCDVFHRRFGVSTVALRYFNVFGKRQRVDSPYAAVVPRFVEALRRGESPVIYGDGEQSRDFTYVGDVVDAVLLACERGEADGQVFNIGCGKRTSVNELLNHLCMIMQVEANPVHEKGRPGEVRDSEADIGKAERLLGYKPKVSLEEGLRRTIKL